MEKQPNAILHQNPESTPVHEGYSRLRPGNPEVAHAMPRKTRNLNAIDPNLRTIIQQLVNAEAKWPLVLIGEAGSGKTCAALVMLDRFNGPYYTLPDLCATRIQAQQNALQWSSGYKKTERELWEQWANPQLAVLDEIGSRLTKEQTPSHFEAETLKKAIDCREGKATVLISNAMIEELAELYNDPIASRLSAGTRFQLDGDRRQQT